MKISISRNKSEGRYSGYSSGKHWRGWPGCGCGPGYAQKIARYRAIHEFMRPVCTKDREN